MKIVEELEYRLLRWLRPGHTFAGAGEARSSYVPKIKRMIGEEGWEGLKDKIILDFGCGIGVGSIELAQHGAGRVIGLDIRPEVLAAARSAAREAGVSNVCEFSERADEPVDVIVSIDAFEHFADPAAVLQTMAALLKEDGFVLLSFGPTWYHPLGGHLFSIFPWSHLIFSEPAQIRWRSEFKQDGATRFGEVAGGLNRMTIQRFLQLVEDSPLQLELFCPVPIRPLRWLHNRTSREFTTAIVESKLVKKTRGKSLRTLQAHERFEPRAY